MKILYEINLPVEILCRIKKYLSKKDILKKSISERDNLPRLHLKKRHIYLKHHVNDIIINNEKYKS